MEIHLNQLLLISLKPSENIITKLPLENISDLVTLPQNFADFQTMLIIFINLIS